MMTSSAVRWTPRDRPTAGTAIGAKLPPLPRAAPTSPVAPIAAQPGTLDALRLERCKAARTEAAVAEGAGPPPPLPPVPVLERIHPFTSEDHAFFAAGDAMSAEPSAGLESFDDLENRPRPTLLRRLARRFASLLRRPAKSQVCATSLRQPAADGPPPSVPRTLHRLLDFLEERRASTGPAADVAEVTRQLRDHLAALEAAVMHEELTR